METSWLGELLSSSAPWSRGHATLDMSGVRSPTPAVMCIFIFLVFSLRELKAYSGVVGNEDDELIFLNELISISC